MVIRALHEGELDMVVDHGSVVAGALESVQQWQGIGCAVNFKHFGEAMCKGCKGWCCIVAG